MVSVGAALATIRINRGNAIHLKKKKLSRRCHIFFLFESDPFLQRQVFGGGVWLSDAVPQLIVSALHKEVVGALVSETWMINLQE